MLVLETLIKKLFFKNSLRFFMRFSSISKPVLLLFLVCIFLSHSLTGQEAKTYSWFDETVGLTSTGLYNGVEYIEQHRNINDNHKFFLSKEFIPGTLHYDGQPYFFHLLKYNVFDEVLLVNSRESLFQLINDKIDGFEIGGHRFINIKAGTHQRVMGFYELLLENEQVLVLKKHSRYMNELRDRKFLHYEFKPKNNDYELRYNNEFFKISSRRDVIRIFPGLKREIREIYSSERALRKSNPDKFMIRLFKEISMLNNSYNRTDI